MKLVHTHQRNLQSLQKFFSNRFKARVKPVALMISLSVGSMMLGGCSMTSSWLGDDTELSEAEQQASAQTQRLTAGKTSRPTLAELNLAPIRAPEADTQENAFNVNNTGATSAKTSTNQVIPILTLQQKKAEYEALLPMISDEAQREQVMFRLADINMLIAEQALEQGTDDQAAKLENAVAGYLEVLNQYSIQAPSVDEQTSQKLMDTMYQLSRALDLLGQPEQSVDVAKDFIQSFPTEEFGLTAQHLELWFRTGEFYFSRQQYAMASKYYTEVMENESALSSSQSGVSQSANNFYTISAYMKGWSLFKLDEYDGALIAFDKMLAASLRNIDNLSVNPIDSLALSSGNMRLVKDSLRVMATTFSYRGDDEAIRNFYSQHHPEAKYHHLVFDELAQQYLDQDRYQDSARVLLGFASWLPAHDRAIEFFIRHIDAFILGDFPDRVLTAKQTFVETYALGNGVLNDFESELGQRAMPYLAQYYPELAQTEHSIAQGFADSDKEIERSLAVESYIKAIAYYRGFIQSFMTYQDYQKDVSSLRYFLAEALFDTGQYLDAAAEFDKYAYASEHNPKAAEAGYSAVLAWDAFSENNFSTTLEQIQARQLSQKKFLETFATDARAPSVVERLMQNLFALESYEQAQRWAMWQLVEYADVHAFSDRQIVNAKLVMARSYLALENYPAAEDYYQDILNNWMRYANQIADTEAGLESRYIELNEALSVAIYQQAEAHLNNGELSSEVRQSIALTEFTANAQQREALQAAIADLQRLVANVDLPQSDAVINAQFDMATYHALLGNWNNALNGWTRFAQRYPQHPRSASVEDLQLIAYEQTQDWNSAAQVLRQRFEKNPRARDAANVLYTAAEYFEKANNRNQALDSYRRYAHAFEQPLGLANEARFKLSEMYRQSNEDSKRRFWLNKMMKAQLALDPQRPDIAGTPRSRYLAAMSAMVFATDADTAFGKIQLTMPLDKTLTRKQKAMQNAIDAYQRVMSFAVADYTTQANYQLANLYGKLATDLMNSERPSGLSELEREQYDILLEEQAYPFEELAIQIHEQNIQRVPKGLYDEHIKQSFNALARYVPFRYLKPEQHAEVTLGDL